LWAVHEPVTMSADGHHPLPLPGTSPTDAPDMTTEIQGSRRERTYIFPTPS
jgi:hypothetical protein